MSKNPTTNVKVDRTLLIGYTPIQSVFDAKKEVDGRPE